MTKEMPDMNPGSAEETEEDFVWDAAAEETRKMILKISKKRPRQEFLDMGAGTMVSYIGDDRKFPLDMYLRIEAINPETETFTINAGEQGIHEIPFRDVVEAEHAQKTMREVYQIVKERKRDLPPVSNN